MMHGDQILHGDFGAHLDSVRKVKLISKFEREFIRFFFFFTRELSNL